DQTLDRAGGHARVRWIEPLAVRLAPDSPVGVDQDVGDRRVLNISAKRRELALQHRAMPALLDLLRSQRRLRPSRKLLDAHASAHAGAGAGAPLPACRASLICARSLPSSSATCCCQARWRRTPEAMRSFSS